MKKGLALLLALVMLLSLAACDKKPEESSQSGTGETKPVETPAQSGEATKPSETPKETEKPKNYAKELKIAIEQFPNKINPIGEPSGPVARIGTMIFNQLVEFNEDTRELDPELATRWEAADARTYTFWLREDVKFANGEPFDADDVYYTFVELPPKAKEAYGTVNTKDVVDAIESLEINGPYQVTFHLKNDLADFLYYLYGYAYAIFNREACEADLDTGLTIGTGAWKLSGFVSGESAVVEKIEDSWVWNAEGACPTEKVTFELYKESGTKLAALELGDIVECVVTQDEVLYLNMADIETVDKQDWKMSYLALNYKYGYFAGDSEEAKNLRRAILYALPMDDMNEVMYGGKGSPAESLWGFIQFGLYEDYDRPNKQDLAYAKECLSKSAYPNGGITIRFQTPGSTSESMWNQAAVIVQATLKRELNIDVDIIMGSMSTINAKVKAMREGTPKDEDLFDIMITSLALTPLAGRFSWTGDPTSSTNRALLVNEDLTRLYKELAITVDTTKRLTIAKEIQEIMHDLAFYWPLMYGASTYAYRKGLTGVIFKSDGYTDFHHIQLEIE